MKTIEETEVINEPIPYFVFERTIARFERTVRRLIIALCIAIALIFASNIAWLWVFNSYEIVTQDVTVDSNEGGDANYIGANGTINNGTGNSKDNGQEEKEE